MLLAYLPDVVCAAVNDWFNDSKSMSAKTPALCSDVLFCFFSASAILKTTQGKHTTDGHRASKTKQTFT